MVFVCMIMIQLVLVLVSSVPCHKYGVGSLRICAIVLVPVDVW